MYRVISSIPMMNRLELLRLTDNKVVYFKSNGFQDVRKYYQGQVVDIVAINNQYVIKKVA
jgi:hypothetical protein